MNFFPFLIFCAICSLNISLTSICLIGLIFWTCLVPFKGKMSTKIFVALLMFFILGTCEGMTSFVLVLLNHIFPSLDLTAFLLLQNSNPRSFIAFLITFDFLLLLVYNFFIPVLQFYLTLLNTKIALCLAFPITGLILMVNVLFCYAGNLQTYLLLIFIFSILFICCCIFFLKGVLLLKEVNKQYLENKMVQEQLNLQITHSQMLDQEYIKIRKWNHDISNHLLSISYLIECGDDSMAEQYIENILQ